MVERPSLLIVLAALLVALAGCAEPGEPGAGVSEPASAVNSEIPAPSETPAPISASYEVAIATAAANRNRALEECEARLDAERPACIEVALANWETERAATNDLRGEQP